MSRIMTPWTSQPQVPVGIDWSNPLTEGLVFATNRSDAGSADLVSGKMPSFNGTNITKGCTRHGVDITSTGVFNYGRTGLDEISGPGTILCISRLINNGGGTCISSGENTFGRGIAFWQDNTSYVNNGFVLSVTTNSQITEHSGGNVYTSYLIPEPLCASWDGTTIKFYARGRLVKTAANTTLPVADANRVTRLSVRNAGAGTVVNAATSIILAWNRALSETEAKSLCANPWQIFQPLTRRIFVPIQVDVSAPPQLLAPIADLSAGGWTPSTGTDLYAMVDEPTASDTDYILSSTATTCEMRLAVGGDPLSSTGHILRYRLLAGSGSITATLMQGTTTIASFGPHALTGAAQDFAQTLSGAQADSITNYGDLRVTFEAS